MVQVWLSAHTRSHSCITSLTFAASLTRANLNLL